MRRYGLTEYLRDFRHKYILQKELRRYVPRSILSPKSPFRPHFGAFYPHPGSKSALRCARGDPLFDTPETCHPTSTWKIFSLPTRDDARTSGHRHFPAGSCLRLTTELAKMERGPIAMSGPVLSVWHQTGRSVRKNPAFPRARHPGYGSWGRVRTGAWLRTNWRAPTKKGNPRARGIQRLRHSVWRGRPFGGEPWTRVTATRPGLESCLRPRGRPRKEEA